MDFPKIILASSSPRRRQLLALSGEPFDVEAADINEDVLPNEEPQAYVSRLAAEKARVVAERHDGEDVIVIAADTTVVSDGEIIGKPVDAVDAERILRRLRGRSHPVYTGLQIVCTRDGATLSDLATTQVPMRNYSDAEMSSYIASGDPMDKAGAYAIQHAEFHPVENLAGCFANVAGLPLCHLLRNLRKWDLDFEVDLPAACQRHLNYECPVTDKILNWEL
jgi:MAF protein